MRGDVLGRELVVYNSSTSRWYTIPIESTENSEKLDLLRYGHQLGLISVIFFSKVTLKQIATINNELFIVTGGLDDSDCSNQIVKLTLT